MNPEVSIIVPNYNHDQFLEKRLESIFNQTFQDFEIILLDDVSTDQSIKILQKYADHPKVSHFVVNKMNSGNAFRQWRRGIDLARGKYIWIAETDDWADVRFLEILVSRISGSARIGLAYSQSYITDENSTVIDVNLSWTKDLDTERWSHDFINNGKKECRHFLSYKNTIPNASAVIFRRKVITQSVIEFPERFQCTGDWYIWVQLLQNCDLAYVAKPLNYFRATQQSTRVHSTKEKKNQRIYEGLKVLLMLKKLNSVDNPTYKERVRYHISWWCSIYTRGELASREFFKILKNIPFQFTPFLLRSFLSKVFYFRISSKLKRPFQN